MEIIISAVISAVSAILVCLIGNYKQNKRSMDKIEQLDALQTYRIEQLEKQADKQEKMIDRVFILERDRDLTREKIENTAHRIMILEQGGKRK